MLYRRKRKNKVGFPQSIGRVPGKKLQQLGPGLQKIPYSFRPIDRPLAQGFVHRLSHPAPGPEGSMGCQGQILLERLGSFP